MVRANGGKKGGKKRSRYGINSHTVHREVIDRFRRAVRSCARICAESQYGAMNENNNVRGSVAVREISENTLLICANVITIKISLNILGIV